MSDKIIQLNEGVIKQELKELVRSSVEETLNNLLEQEAAELTKAERYERTQERQGYRLLLSIIIPQKGERFFPTLKKIKKYYPTEKKLFQESSLQQASPI
ncbi:hypothetical protein B9R14_06590 [Acetivibrio saccincola]|uniref:Transposase, Mutator family n=1 Tax=Acetivibrio saccincola TaxID=1677857 RepID=A0A2S8R9G8_9FIRM|nr:hypothetical protein B9R14_06590 [Acetivibrio saccincola]